MFAWDDLKHFLEFARKGSILAAAKAQGVNSSTVHRRLAALQEALKVTLFERHVGSYRLTETGVALLPFAEQIEAAVTEFERRAASSEKGLIGAVRVTCAPTVGDRLRRTRLLETFEQRFPGLHVELLLTDRFVDLSKREADIAIRSQGCGVDDETLVGRKIAEGPWAVYASRSYVKRHGNPAGPADIARHCVVKFEGTIAEHQAAQWMRAAAPDARITTRTESFPGLVLAVKSGAALAPLPTALGDEENELVRVINNVPELVTHFYLLMHRDMQHTPRVRAFFNFVVTEIKAFRAVLAGNRGIVAKR
jgi:DNA-binding transcriptional LysR family regulator